jgi:hypothetical protein
MEKTSRLAVLAFLAFLLCAAPVFAQTTRLDIDVDDNQATDIEYGGTNANSVEEARANLELGTSATKDVGTASGTVASGDHDHAGTYQPADPDLDAAANATGSGNSKYFGTNPSGTVGMHDLPSGASNVDDGTAVGQVPIWDGDSYAPGDAFNNVGLSGGTAGTYAVWDGDGKLASGDSVGRIAHYNRDTLSDTSSAHALTAAEVSGTIINNYSSSAAASEFDLPAAAGGYNTIFQLGQAQNVTINPTGTDVMYLNGTALAAGEAIVNTSPAVGQSITCYTFQTGASTWAWNCRTADEDFEEETP